jgi:gliding motility-associated-like protein
MRPLFFVIAFIFFSIFSKSQTLIATTGNTVFNTVISIDYSVGEVVTTTLQSSSSSLVSTQGFLQPYITAIAPAIKPFNIPNAFSPNGDNINDTWTIDGIELYNNCRVYIYNRYGQEVYKSAGTYIPWKGLTNGKPVATGVYYYIIEPEAGKKSYAGWLLLLR